MPTGVAVVSMLVIVENETCCPGTGRAHKCGVVQRGTLGSWPLIKCCREAITICGTQRLVEPITGRELVHGFNARSGKNHCP